MNHHNLLQLLWHRNCQAYKEQRQTQNISLYFFLHNCLCVPLVIYGHEVHFKCLVIEEDENLFWICAYVTIEVLFNGYYVTRETQITRFERSIKSFWCTCMQHVYKTTSSGTVDYLVLPVPLLYLLHQLISGKLPSDHHDQVLNDILSTVHIQQTAYHHW